MKISGGLEYDVVYTYLLFAQLNKSIDVGIVTSMQRSVSNDVHWEISFLIN